MLAVKHLVVTYTRKYHPLVYVLDGSFQTERVADQMIPAAIAGNRLQHKELLIYPFRPQISEATESVRSQKLLCHKTQRIC